MNFNAWLLHAVVAAALASVVAAGECKSCDDSGDKCDKTDKVADPSQSYDLTDSRFTYSNKHDVAVVLVVTFDEASGGDSNFLVDPKESCDIVGSADAKSAKVKAYAAKGPPGMKKQKTNGQDNKGESVTTGEPEKGSKNKEKKDHEKGSGEEKTEEEKEKEKKKEKEKEKENGQSKDEDPKNKKDEDPKNKKEDDPKNKKEDDPKNKKEDDPNGSKDDGKGGKKCKGRTDLCSFDPSVTTFLKKVGYVKDGKKPGS